MSFFQKIVDATGLNNMNSLDSVPPEKRPKEYLKKMPNTPENKARREALAYVKDLIERKGTNSPASLLKDAKDDGILAKDPLTWVNLALSLSPNRDVFLYPNLRQEIIEALGKGKQMAKQSDRYNTSFVMSVEKEAKRFLDKTSQGQTLPEHAAMEVKDENMRPPEATNDNTPLHEEEQAA